MKIYEACVIVKVNDTCIFNDDIFEDRDFATEIWNLLNKDAWEIMTVSEYNDYCIATN